MKMIKTIAAIAMIISLQGCTKQSQALPNKDFIEHRCLDNKLYEVTPQKVKALRDIEGNFLDCPYTTF